MRDAGLCFQPLATVAELIREHQVSPLEVINAVLDETERVGRTLNCYILVFWKAARRRARALEELLSRGIYLGPLHGIPIAVKDNIAVADAPTTAGSPALRDWRPSRSATVVGRLAAAGAVVVAKANLYEFAYGAPHPQFGPVRNPWNLDRTSGGSSNGSAAAVASGLCYAALGTDTGGSIRVPAAFCSVVGLKPSFGRVSRYGVIPISESLDHVGPLARTVRDAAVVLSVIAGHDAEDPTTAVEMIPDYLQRLEDGVRGIRLGVFRPWASATTDPEVRSALEQAFSVLERAGAELQELQAPDFSEGQAAAGVIMAVEAAEYHRPYLQTRAHRYNPVLRARLESGERMLAVEYVRAQRTRQHMIQQLGEIFTTVDALILPAHPASAYPLDARTVLVDGHEEDLFAANTRFTRLFNLTGHPAIVVPCGFTMDGLPIALQIVGRPFEEVIMLRVARAYEQATDWHRRRPPII